MQFSRFLLICVAACSLTGCAAQTLSQSNQLHAALLYAPQPSPLPQVANLPATDPCGAGGGITPPADRRATGDDFVALPGMTISATQTNARLSGASDAPVVASWSWTLPQPASSRCATSGWSQRDLLMVRTLLFGARKENVTKPPEAGSPFDPRLWGASVRCAGLGAPADCKPDGAGPATWSRLQTSFLDPFVTRLHLTVAGGGALPSGTSGAASALAAREQVVADDFPAGGDDPRVSCVLPERWNGLGGADPIPEPCDAAHKQLRLRAGGSPVPTLNCPKVLGDSAECFLLLLESNDRLQLNAPRPVGQMVSPSFDLAGPRPGSGYDYPNADLER